MNELTPVTTEFKIIQHKGNVMNSFLSVDKTLRTLNSDTDKIWAE
jgi:hypothetical protein